jgi:plasmid maintenance system antidote protein VapI
MQPHETFTQIAAEFSGVSRERVRQIAKARCDVTGRGDLVQARREAPVDAVMEMWADPSISMTEMARRLGVSHPAISSVLDDLDIPPPRGRRAERWPFARQASALRRRRKIERAVEKSRGPSSCGGRA